MGFRLPIAYLMNPTSATIEDSMLYCDVDHLIKKARWSARGTEWPDSTHTGTTVAVVAI